MNALRVAHVVATVGRTGVESHLQVLFESLREQRVVPVLIAPASGPLTDWMELRGFEVRRTAPAGRSGFLQIPTLIRALKDVEIVHSHGPRPIWWSALLASLFDCPPRVATIHQFGRSGLQNGGRRMVFGWAERKSLRAQQALITVSEYLRRLVIRSTGIAPERIHTVHNSAAVLFQPPRRLPSRSEPSAIVVARLHPEKGIDILLEAWRILRSRGVNLRLEIVGDGPERNRLDLHARNAGLTEQVRFSGWCEDVLPKICAASIYTAPSRVETFGISVLEAMAVRVLPIATAVGGHKEMIEPAAPRLLVPPDDPIAFADRVEEVLALPEKDLDRMADALQERAYECYHPIHAARRTREIYDSVLGSGLRIRASGFAANPAAASRVV